MWVIDLLVAASAYFGKALAARRDARQARLAGDRVSYQRHSARRRKALVLGVMAILALVAATVLEFRLST
ncbi:MAG: hypothetical protein JWR53_708 [Glaciihabitans sp.]|jgi:hypothetical protein|nr:hypothetical protein [Glaciihabitans sp.]